MDWDEQIKKWEKFNDIIFFWGNPSLVEGTPAVFCFSLVIIFSISSFMRDSIEENFSEKVKIIKINENSVQHSNVKINNNKETLSSIEHQEKIESTKDKLILSSLESQKNANEEIIIEIKNQQKINEEMTEKIKKQQKEIENIILNLKDK